MRTIFFLLQLASIALFWLWMPWYLYAAIGVIGAMVHAMEHRDFLITFVVMTLTVAPLWPAAFMNLLFMSFDKEEQV